MPHPRYIRRRSRQHLKRASAPIGVVVTVELPASSVNELARLFQSLVQERTQSSGSQTVIDIDAALDAARAAQEGK
jgi:hypothetical protein